MRKGTVAALVLVLVVTAAAGGYVAGETNQHVTTMVSTSTALSTTMTTVTTTTVTTVTGVQGACSPLSGFSAIPIPVGFDVNVSYVGNWSVSIATFAAKSIDASGFSYACSSMGNGTTTFYVGLANYTGEWNTVLVMGHKFGSSGTLTVSASIGNETSSNRTSQPYGSAFTTLSFSLAG